MEDFSHWFVQLNGWVGQCLVADYPGTTQNSLTVGNIVQRDTFQHVHNTDHTSKRQYRVQRIEYESNKIVQVELLEIAVLGASLIKVPPGEVKRVKSSTLNIQRTQELLASSQSLLTSKTITSSKRTASISTQAHTDTIKESVVQLEELVERLHTAGTSLQRDVIAFMWDGIDINHAGEDNAAEQKVADNASSTTHSPSITALIAAAEADVVSVSNIMWRYDVLFGAARDLYMVLTSLLPIAAAFQTSITATHAPSTANSKSFDVQDIENDSTPVKSRPIDSNGDIVASVESVICKILTLEPLLVKLIELHPIPYVTTVKDWAASMCAMSALSGASRALHTACTAHATANSSINSANTSAALHAHHTTIQQALRTHFEQVGQAQVSHYSQCMVDNIMRQDWPSHSKYMRDKKCTHGMVALCTTLRQSVFEMHQQYVLCMATTMPYCADLRCDCFGVLSLQMLLSTAILVGRTYLGHYHTDTTSTSGADNSAGDFVFSPILAPSRVRTAQWRKDQFYFVSMVLETVVWVVLQYTAQCIPSGNGRGDGSTGARSVKDVLQLAAYAEHATVVCEIVAVLRYMLLALYISTNSNAGEVVKNISSIVNTGGGGTATTNGAVSVGEEVYQSLVQLVQCLSNSDHLHDYVHLITPSTAADDTSPNPDAADPPLTPQLVPPTQNYRVYGDMHTHTGLFTFHINPTSNSMSVYQTELTVATTANGGVSNSSVVTSAQRAVVFCRVDTMCIAKPQSLLNLLTTDVDLFGAVHCEIHPPDDQYETSHLVRKFVRTMLSRRYELNPATYPALTSEEIAAAIAVQDFAATL